MRKFTNKQAAKIEQWLDEAFNDGYKAAELDAKFLFTAEANMKRAEAEFNKRDQPIEQRVKEQLGHPLYGRSPAFEAMYQIELMKELEYGTPDELSKVAPCSEPTASIWSGRHFLGNVR